jgi:hypothetical protein
VFWAGQIKLADSFVRTRGNMPKAEIPKGAIRPMANLNVSNPAISVGFRA